MTFLWILGRGVASGQLINLERVAYFETQVRANRWWVVAVYRDLDGGHPDYSVISEHETDKEAGAALLELRCFLEKKGVDVLRYPTSGGLHE